MQRRTCVTGRNPDEYALVPDFDTPFFRGDSIAEIGEALIAHFDEFKVLRDYRIAYFWKKKGGVKGETAILGGASRASGLAGHLTQATFHIWLAADNCKGFANYELEAALYHQLCHLDETEVESSKPEIGSKQIPVTRAYDLEMFQSEVERYGLWTIALRHASNTFAQQLKLELAPAKSSQNDDDWSESDEEKRRGHVGEKQATEAAAAERELTGISR